MLIAAQRGDGETALREAQLEPDPGFRRFELAVAHYVRGDREAADAALADLIANCPGGFGLSNRRGLRRCEARKIKLSNGYKPRLMIATPGCLAFRWIRYYAACATIPDTRTCSPKSVYLQRHEQQSLHSSPS